MRQGEIAQIGHLPVERPLVVAIPQVREGHLLGSVQAVADVAERHRTMVSLDHERTARGLIVPGGGAGGAAQFDVFVEHDAVQSDAHEGGVTGLQAGRIKTRRPEYDVQVLPEPRRAGDVDGGGMAFVAFLALGTRFVPPFIDATDISRTRRRDAPAIEELNLVAALEINTRIRAPGHHDLEIQFDIGVFPRGKQVVSGALRLDIGEDTRSRRRRKGLIGVTIRRKPADNLPVAGGGLEAPQVVERQGGGRRGGLLGCGR